MAVTMTTKERFTRMYEHREADRIPIIDSPWGGTISRWHKEGMPVDADWTKYFDIDQMAYIGVDNSPRYPTYVIEEDEKSITTHSAWGVTMRQFKAQDSSPEFLDFDVTTPEKWEECKARMLDFEGRINWDYLKNEFPKWRADGRWIIGGFWFGFDVTHSWMMGTENLLIAMMEEPEMVKDMFETYLDCCIHMYDEIWDRGYHFDCISWPDDQGYKGTLFFSNEVYREILKPAHKRAIDWAHNHGIYAHMHSCGCVMDRIDDFMDIGLDALNPLEVKAGMQPLVLKEKYGDRLTLHGGINAVLWDDKEAILEEIRRVVPKLKENGGYIFSSDHSIPNSVSLDNFRAIVEEVKKVGAYD